jgi:hypothetical protein
VKISGEVCPHHIALTDAELAAFDSNFKMNPPLRSEEDIEAMLHDIRLLDGALGLNLRRGGLFRRATGFGSRRTCTRSLHGGDGLSGSGTGAGDVHGVEKLLTILRKKSNCCNFFSEPLRLGFSRKFRVPENKIDLTRCSVDFPAIRNSTQHICAAPSVEQLTTR